jgi:hypothetical protein
MKVAGGAPTSEVPETVMLLLLTTGHKERCWAGPELHNVRAKFSENRSCCSDVQMGDPNSPLSPGC